MRKVLISTLIVISALSVSGLVSAAGQASGGSYKLNASSTNSNGKRSSDRDFGRERAADRVGSKSKAKSYRAKSKAAANSNRIKSLDKDKGRERAADPKELTRKIPTVPSK